MSDKQRADHVQAKYWDGFITRTEAQKVFDEQTKVIQFQAQAMGKFDAVLSCMAEKMGLNAQDVNDWVTKKVQEAAEAAKAKGATDGSNQGSADTQPEVSRIIAA